MPYTIEDFKRELRKEVLSELTPEQLRQDIPIEDLRNALPTEERFRGVTPEQLRQAVPLETLFKSLSKEEIEFYLKKLYGGSP